MVNSIFSSSSSVNPQFFKPMLPGFNTHLSVPGAFYSKHLEKREEGNEAELRSDASENITWKIQLEDHRFTKGWEKFAMAHNLQVGDILILRYEGNLMFHVTPFGPSCCEVLYSHKQEDERNSKNKTGKLKVKKNPKNEWSSSPDSDINFVGPVTASNLRVDSLFPFFLPRGFKTSSGLCKLCNEISLVDEKGRSFTLDVKYQKSSNRFRVKRGWRGMRTTLHSKKTKKDDLEVEQASAKENKNVESLSLSDNSSFVVHVTVSNLREDRLFVPVMISRSNILNERFHEIRLMNKQGRTWTLSLKYSKSSSQFYITRGWKSFCEANGQKAGCSLLFKLVRNRTAPVLLMTSEELIEKKPSHVEEM